MRNRWMMVLLTVGMAVFLLGGVKAMAQDESAETPVEVAPGATLDEAAQEGGDTTPSSFFGVVKGGGPVGIMLWLAILLTSVAGIYLIIDSFVKIREKKIMPPDLVARVRESMENGDLAAAMEHCRSEPGVMANILMAGFSNVEEGFEVIQDSINAAADLESEKLLQKVTYLSVVSNLAPMLGLMGTVQGMILAFGTLATMEAGAAQQSLLAMNISQALYTTMAGLSVAVPAVAFYYYFRNQANNIILNMVITTIDLIKALRNVEVVEE